jgi:hypothetical protein
MTQIISSGPKMPEFFHTQGVFAPHVHALVTAVKSWPIAERRRLFSPRARDVEILIEEINLAHTPFTIDRLLALKYLHPDVGVRCAAFLALKDKTEKV